MAIKEKPPEVFNADFYEHAHWREKIPSLNTQIDIAKINCALQR